VTQRQLPVLNKLCWEKTSEHLVNSCLRGALLPQCFTCDSSSHFAAHCPFSQSQQSFRGSYSQQPFRGSSPASGSPRASNPYSYTSPTFRNSQSSARASSTASPSAAQSSQPFTKTCNRYNHNQGRCSQPCPFPHVRNRCFKPGHPGISCWTKP